MNTFSCIGFFVIIAKPPCSAVPWVLREADLIEIQKTKNEEFSQEVPRFLLLLFVKARVVYRLHSTTKLTQNPHNLSKMLETWIPANPH